MKRPSVLTARKKFPKISSRDTSSAYIQTKLSRVKFATKASTPETSYVTTKPLTKEKRSLLQGFQPFKIGDNPQHQRSMTSQLKHSPRRPPLQKWPNQKNQHKSKNKDARTSSNKQSSTNQQWDNIYLNNLMTFVLVSIIIVVTSYLYWNICLHMSVSTKQLVPMCKKIQINM